MLKKCILFLAFVTMLDVHAETPSPIPTQPIDKSARFTSVYTNPYSNLTQATIRTSTATTTISTPTFKTPTRTEISTPTFKTPARTEISTPTFKTPTRTEISTPTFKTPTRTEISAPTFRTPSAGTEISAPTFRTPSAGTEISAPTFRTPSAGTEISTPTFKTPTRTEISAPTFRTPSAGTEISAPTFKARYLTSQNSTIQNLRTETAQVNEIQALDIEAKEVTMHPLENAPENPKAGELYYNKSGALCLYIVDNDLGEAYWHKVSGLDTAVCNLK